MKISKGLITTFLVLIILAAGARIYFYKGVKTDSSSKSAAKIPDLLKIGGSENPTPTPFEFNELTIPYLRQKKFVSQINSLQQIAENSNYVSHIASYNSDGYKINGQLTIPKNEIPANGYPAIIFIHGYIPPKSYRTKVNYLSYVDYLAKNGFVVFKIDLRGHDQSEGEAGGAYYSGDYVSDALNAYSALENFEKVNKNAIGFWGHSMAGNIVFRSIVVKKNVPASVIWAGAGYTYADLQEYMIDDNSYRPPSANSEIARKRARLRELHGSFEPGHWFWKQVPGTNYLDGVNGAIQLNHAHNDNVVSIEYSRNLMKILDGSRIIHELREYNSGGHNLTGAAFSQAMQNSVEFFRKYLK